MADASPRWPFQRNIRRHRSLTLMKCQPSRYPRSFSKRLPGGTRRSASDVASSTIWSLRKSAAAEIGRNLSGCSVVQEVVAEPVITKADYHERQLHCTTVPSYGTSYDPPSSSATRLTIRWMKTTLKLTWLATSGRNSVTKLPMGSLAQPLAMRSAPGPHPIF